MAERERSGLAGVASAGGAQFGSAASGVSLAERWPLAMFQLTAMSDAALPAIEAAIGLLMPEPGASAANAELTALWCGASRWLAVGPRAAHAGLAARLAASAPHVAVVDLSHARTVLRIEGPRSRDVLAKLCALDLHPRAFAGGRCAVSGVAGLTTLIHKLDEAPIFDLFVQRSFALEIWDCVRAAGAEFGASIGRPPL